MQQSFSAGKAGGSARALVRAPILAAWLIGLAAAVATPVFAVEIDTGVPELRLRWDNTIGYSVGLRTESPSPTLTQGPAAISYNDGDLNFSKRSRPITNRFDLFSEADLTYHGFGARVSAAGWYDFAYHTHTSNPSGLAPDTAAPFSQSATLNGGMPGEFPAGTRDLNGGMVEVLDGFVFGTFDLGTVPVSLRLGRHALTWGETLFFGANGIAAGMAPVDFIKLQSSPNATFKEIIRAVNQLSAQAQLMSGVSVAAYYQLQWQKSRFPGVGSYYSSNDTFDAGGERIILGNFAQTPFGPLNLPLQRVDDRKPTNSGEAGVSTHLRVPSTEIDVGLYAIQYNSRTPVVYAYLNAASVGSSTYQLLYPERIRSYAVSANTTVLDNVDVGSEVSLRTNAPLARGLIFPPGAGFDAKNNPAYSVGRTLHANLSTITVVPPFFLARESNLTAEIAWNRVLSCTKMCADLPPSPQLPFGFTARDRNAKRDSTAVQLVYTPTYRQVASGVDLSVPFGISYSPNGESEALGPLFVDHGGTMTLGLVGTVREAVTIALNYTHYYGSAALPLDNSGYFTFGQTLKDRDNVTLSARFSF